MSPANPQPVPPSSTSTSASASAYEKAVHYVDNILRDGEDIRRTQHLALQAHEARRSDIILNTHPKSGTVLLQQMCYQISVHASDNDSNSENFEDIIQVVPFVEREHVLKCGVPKTYPRVYKTHLKVHDFAKVSKHIVLARDPKKFAASFLNFLFFPCNPQLEGKLPQDDVMQHCVNELTDKFMLKEKEVVDGSKLGGWHSRLKHGVNMKDKRTLVIFYEDIVKDLHQAIKRIARFMDCTLSEEDVNKVAIKCDRETMANDVRFHGHYEYRALGMPSELVHVFPENFKGFKKFKVSSTLVEKLQEMNLRAFGVKTYDEIREMVNKEQLEIHGY